MSEQKVGSFLPSEFSEGGFFDDKTCVIKKAEVVEFDYNGQRSDDPSCAIAITFLPDDAESEEDARTEYYGIGKMSKFTPTADRKFYVPTGPSAAMNKSAKAALFLTALAEKGFDMSLLSAGIDALEGLHVHVNQVPMPEMKARPGEEKREKKAMVLIVSKILEPLAAGTAAPKKAAGTKKAAAPKAAASASAPVTTVGGDDVDEETAATLTGIILNLLASKEGPVNKQLVPGLLFKEIPNDQQALRNKAMKAMANVAWLSGDDQPWTYDGGMLAMKG